MHRYDIVLGKTEILNVCKPQLLEAKNTVLTKKLRLVLTLFFCCLVSVLMLMNLLNCQYFLCWPVCSCCCPTRTSKNISCSSKLQYNKQMTVTST